MDILYIIGEGCSKCNYNELKYSLRSIEQYGKNVGKVYVAGYCPSWLSDEVTKLPFTQPYDAGSDMAKKAANILATILYAIDNSNISDEFLVSMDDHFYIRNVDFDNYPFYAKRYGDNNKLPVNGGTGYKKFLVDTREYLNGQGLSKYYLCPHRNMHCSKTIIREIRSSLNQIVSNALPVESFCYMLNYRYTVKKDFEIVAVDDVKLQGGCDWYQVNPEQTEVFSTVDFEPGIGLDCLISGLYSKKSKYENE